jgi:hypothetical protein
MTDNQAYSRIGEFIESHQSDSYSEIGRQLGLSRSQVTRIAKRQGIKRQSGKRSFALEAALAAIEAATPKPECDPVGEADPRYAETISTIPDSPPAVGQAAAAAETSNADVQ